VPTGYGAAVAVAGWGLGGLGMGLVYPSVTTLALAQTPDARKGATSGSLQLAETLSAALVAGLSGGLVAHAETAGQDARTGLATVFTLTSAAALAGIAVAVRTLARKSRARERSGAPRDQGV
jgi:MFS family permease